MMRFSYAATAAALLTLAMGTPCTDDIEDASAQLAKATEEILMAVKDCPVNATSCAEDTSEAVTYIGVAAQDINKAVGDCGGASSQCAADLTQLVTDLGVAGDAVSKAVVDCGAKKALTCLQDVYNTSKALVACGKTIGAAVTDCKSGLALLSKATGRTIEIAPGVMMPSMNLGTCCGSEPKVGLAPYLAAGGIGIDTAFDYNDQVDIAVVLAAPASPSRSSLFITTKIPAGFGNSTDCDPDPMIAVNYIKENLRELNVEYVDLALVHRPCQASQTKDPVASNNALWKGMQMALAMNLTRAIGVSNYKADDLKTLDMSKGKPAVNQCEMSVVHHDDASIAYSQAQGIVYESYFTMKGCPFKNAKIGAIATAHNVSVAQVCLRWVLERGGILAVGTGDDASTVGPYAHENLDIYNFALSSADMDTLNHMQI